jgi:hypothetical protein
MVRKKYKPEKIVAKCAKLKADGGEQDRCGSNPIDRNDSDNIFSLMLGIRQLEERPSQTPEGA